MTTSLTFDTGALIGLERRRPHVRRIHQTALLEGIAVFVPSVVMAIGLVGAGVVDALVMASASLRGDLVYTSDPADLEQLARVFRNVRVETI